MKIVIIGAGVAGAVLARRLSALPGVQLLCLEKVAPDDHAEAGTGLNVGPNAIKALRLTDAELAAQVEGESLPWRRWTTALADGTPLFDLPLDQVADNPGIRIRWSELYRVLRAGAGSAVRYGCQVTGMGRDTRDAGKTFVTWIEDGEAHRLDGIDLLVGADGRYSAVRQCFAGTPEPRHIGVAILRALVEDTSGGLVDDYVQFFNGPHRMLAFRVPADHVYIAATFPVAPGAPVQASWNTEAVMRATWQPTSGKPAHPQLQWLLDALCGQLADSHWARMQESGIRFHEPDAGVLYLGDSAHGMAPTLGQGATQALEDACAAVQIIEDAVRNGEHAVARWLERIARTRTGRIRFATELSVQATDTMLAGADPVAGAKWKTERPFLEDLARLYREPALGREADTLEPGMSSDGALTLGLFHLAIKTANLEATRAFWVGVIGLRDVPRPDFGYPGAWLACPQPGGQAIIHVYAGGPALGPGGKVEGGTAAIDHVSLACAGFHAYRARFERAGLPWREFLVPGTTLWQLFVYDPSGVQLELTFEGSAEDGAPPDMSPGRSYVAGQSFFSPETYPHLQEPSHASP